MNEEAIKILKVQSRVHAANKVRYGNVLESAMCDGDRISALWDVAAYMKSATDEIIGVLEEEDRDEGVRLKTLCVPENYTLTTDPPMKQCKHCRKTWYVTTSTPICGGRSSTG